MVDAVVRNSREQYIKFRIFDATAKDPAKTYVFTVIMLLFTVLCFFLGQVVYAMICFAMAAILPIILYLTAYLSAKSQLKKNPEYLKIVSKYHFERDFFAVLYSGGKNLEKMKYENLYCAIETKDIFYLYVSQTDCLIIPKSCIVSKNPEVLSELIKGHLDKYRKYLYKKHS